jgi:hypothetical protein
MIDATDYGILTAPDVGITLNTIWTHVSNGDTIYIPAGEYNYATPIVWTGKSFTLSAEQVAFQWNGANASVVSFTMDTDNSCIDGLELYGNTQLTALNLKNASHCLLNRMSWYGFGIGLLHSCDTGSSRFNVIRDVLTNCNIGVKQVGVNASGLKIVGHDSEDQVGDTGTNIAFDFSEGGGYNHVIMGSIQTTPGSYAMKGTHDEFFFQQYEEGTDWIQWTGDNNVYMFPDTGSSKSGTWYDAVQNFGYEYRPAIMVVHETGWVNPNPWFGATMYIEDLGSNNKVITPGFKQNYPPGILSQVGFATYNSITVSYTASTNTSGPPYKYDWRISQDNKGKVNDWKTVSSQTGQSNPATFTFTGYNYPMASYPLSPGTKYWLWVRVADVDNIPTVDFCISVTTANLSGHVIPRRG